MICVVQRANEASVEIINDDNNIERRSIGPGLVVLAGVERGDDERVVLWAADKIARLRIFQDDDGRMNRSVLESGGEVLVVSQFTLAGDIRKGTRPSFVGAEIPELASPLIDRFVARLRAEHGLMVQTGAFGAKMRVALVNDGPVTIIVQRDAEES